MPISVDKTNHYKIIRKTCLSANIAYLIIRLLYLILFLISKAYILAIVDGVTILIYLSFFLLLKKKKYYPYALLCGNEYIIFVSVTTVMLGFETGFHFYLIGLCVVSFFTTYFSKVKTAGKSLIWVGLSLAIYLTLYLVTRFNEPYYAIDKWLEMTLFILHAVMVFGFVAFYLVVFVRYAISLESKITSQSRTDELTKINNRYALYDYFEQEEDRSSSLLALFDIDDFKVINDTYGHSNGDIILRRVAEIATEQLEDSFVCRYGGEEFVVVMKERGDRSFFDRLEALRKSVENEPFVIEGKPVRVTITIGARKYGKETSIEKWIELADNNMYSGKRSGKNVVIIG